MANLGNYANWAETDNGARNRLPNNINALRARKNLRDMLVLLKTKK
jgi:hypothetical protein